MDKGAVRFLAGSAHDAIGLLCDARADSEPGDYAALQAARDVLFRIYREAGE